MEKLCASEVGGECRGETSPNKRLMITLRIFVRKKTQVAPL